MAGEPPRWCRNTLLLTFCCAAASTRWCWARRRAGLQGVGTEHGRARLRGGQTVAKGRVSGKIEAAGDDATQIRLTGSLQVYPERLPGVPRILARRVGPAVEKWLMNMVTPNLARLPRAIQALLDSDG